MELRTKEEIEAVLKIARKFGLNGCASKLYDLNECYNELKAQLKDANEVIDFYGDKSNWSYSELVSEEGNNGGCVFHTGIKESDIRFELGGKRAREYKEKYKVN